VGHEEAVPQRHADWVSQVNGQGMPAHELYKSGQSRNMANKDSTNDARWGFKRLLCKTDKQVEIASAKHVPAWQWPLHCYLAFDGIPGLSQG